MIKSSLKKIANALGFSISRVNSVNNADKEFFKSSNEDLDYFETPIGNYYLPNNAPNDHVISIMKRGKYFDENIINVAKKYIKPGTSVLDLGAHLGQMSILFSKLVGPEGKIYSFDADDYIYEILKKNIAANHCTNIQHFFGAVYNENDKMLYFPKPDVSKFGAYGSYGLQPNTDKGREVKSITIDRLNIAGPISFMKIDVQGSDLFALEGAVETIKKNKMPIIFEFEQQFQNDFNTTFQDYIDFVNKINYKFIETIDGINYLIMPK